MSNQETNFRSQTLEQLSVGIVIGFVCGMPIGLGLVASFADHFESILIIVIVLLFLISILILFVYYSRERLFNWLRIKIVKTPSDISNEFSNLIVSSQSSDKIKITDSSIRLFEMIVGLIAWHRLRVWLFNLLIGVIVAFTGLAGSALLYQQNQTLIEQTQWFTKQTEHIDNQSIEATRSSLFAHALAVQNVLVENPDLYDYFYNGKMIDKSLTEHNRIKINVISEMICDMLDHAANSNALSGETKEGWKVYANSMMQNSPPFRDFLLHNKEWYPTIGEWIDFSEYE